jgi:hypothetical protein
MVADRGERMDVDVGADFGGGADVCEWADADALGFALWTEMAKDGRERLMDVVDLNGREMGGGEIARGHDGGGRTIFQAMIFFGLVDECDLAGLDILLCSGATDDDVGIANDLPANQGRQFGKSSLHDAESFPR